jgi:hypothetical protein
MLHPLVLALRSRQIVSPFIIFSDRILEKFAEINPFLDCGFRNADCGLNYSQKQEMKKTKS